MSEASERKAAPAFFGEIDTTLMNLLGKALSAPFSIQGHRVECQVLGKLVEWPGRDKE